MWHEPSLLISLPRTTSPSHPDTPLQVTSKPAESMDEITRPSKRGKSGEEAAAASSGAQDKEEEEEDVEMVGTKGGSALPHNRFDCPEVHEREQRVRASISLPTIATCCFAMAFAGLRLILRQPAALWLV